MNNDRVAVVITAIGHSSSQCSALLPIGQFTALERLLALYQSCGIKNLAVIVPPHAPKLVELLHYYQIRPLVAVEPPAHTTPSTAKLALSHLAPEVTTVLFQPAEFPCPQPTTISTLLSQSAQLVVPMYQQRPGYPLCFAKDFLATVHSCPDLDSFLTRYAASVTPCPCTDAGTVANIESSAGRQAILAMAAKEHIPDATECEALLAKYKTPLPRINHSRKVMQIAIQTAHRYNRKGTSLNTDLIRASSLLHDLVRDREHHAFAAAQIIREQGWFQTAHIVAQHSDLSPIWQPNETALVYLADKMVDGSDIVGLYPRFQKRLNAFANDINALAVIKRRYETALSVENAFHEIVAKLQG